MSGAAICRVPSCGWRAYDHNGVCKRHNHHRDYCGCVGCLEARPAEDAKPDRRTVHINGGTLVERIMPVSLAREPWA